MTTPTLDSPQPATGSGTDRIRALRPYLGLLLLVAACWAAVLVTLPARGADPVLVSTTPAADQATRGADIRLTFDRPVPAALATVLVTTPAGEQFVSGRPYHPDGMADTVAVAMPETRYQGTYSVAWTVPTDGGGAVEGTFRFYVFAPQHVVAEPVLPAGPDVLVGGVHLALRALTVLAFALAAGLAFWTALGVLDVRRGAARRLLLGAWWAVAGGTVLVLLTHGPYAGRASLLGALDPALVPATLASGTGEALQARLLGLVLATIGLAQLLGAATGSRTARGLRALAVLATAGASALTWAFTESQPVVPTVAVLLAGAVVVGGLAVLPLRRSA